MERHFADKLRETEAALAKVTAERDHLRATFRGQHIDKPSGRNAARLRPRLAYSKRVDNNADYEQMRMAEDEELDYCVAIGPQTTWEKLMFGVLFIVLMVVSYGLYLIEVENKTIELGLKHNQLGEQVLSHREHLVREDEEF